VAAMLHLFFLGVFTWMFLEGVQLYRMVVQVFNTTIRPLYLYVIGYGIPLVIVVISAIVRPQRYGTDQYCWLSLKDGLIWSFFVICLFHFLSFALFSTSPLPPRILVFLCRAFTVTAIAQMCVLGLMWVFGAFLFRKEAVVEAYIFTIFNSLQGALVFLLHCLLSKQVEFRYPTLVSNLTTMSSLSHEGSLLLFLLHLNKISDNFNHLWLFLTNILYLDLQLSSTFCQFCIILFLK
uniref:G-protein coupled receptors family 2 profile 2 domain-containing protein n=1 Tax=Mola mola TaxID=94237 RepID=A0A3Q3XMG1_MOLML